MKTNGTFLKSKIILLLFISAILINGCKKDDINMANTSSNEVQIKHNSYSPASLTVLKGTTVKWTNTDSYVHTVTSNINGMFDSDQLHQYRTYSYTFDDRGTYSYYDKNQAGTTTAIVGIIVVK